MNKEKRVVDYYLLCNKLKNVIRTGWIDWNVNKERIESVAEHIYGVQMLAIAMNSEYNYKIDLEKVILMLAVHELGEIIIGDLTSFQISKDMKEKIEHEAVHNILSKLTSGDYIEDLFLEFDKRETNEAKFAYQCDKLECDIQCKIYDEENTVDLNNQKDNTTVTDKEVQKLLKDNKSFSDMWISYDQEHCSYDDNFMSISNYLLGNTILNDEDKSN